MLKKSISWVAGGNVVRAFLQIFFIAIISRLVTPEEFGKFALLLVIINFTNIFNQLGLAPAIIQKKDLSTSELSNSLVFSLFFSFGVAVIYLIIVPYYLVFFGQSTLLLYADILAVFFPVSSLSLLLESEYKRNLNFKSVIQKNLIATTLGYGLVTILLGYLGFGIWALVIGFLAQPTVLLLSYSKRLKIIFNIKFRYHLIQPLVSFGIKNTFSNLFNFLGEEGDKFLFGKFFAVDLLGAYTRSFQLYTYPSRFLGLTYDTVFFPYFSRNQDNNNYIKQHYLVIIKLSFTILLPVSFLLMINSHIIINLFLGNQWHNAIPLFSILILGLAFRFGVKISKSVIKATNLVSFLIYIQLIYAIIIIVGIITFNNLGYLSTPYIVVSATIVNFILVFLLIVDKLEISLYESIVSFLPGVLILFLLIILHTIFNYLLKIYTPLFSLFYFSVFFLVILTTPSFFLGFSIKDARNLLTNQQIF